MTDAINVHLSPEWEALTARLQDPAHVIFAGNRITAEAAEVGAGAAAESLRDRGTGLAERTIQYAGGSDGARFAAETFSGGVGPQNLQAMQSRVWSLMSDARTISVQTPRPAGTVIPILMAARWTLGNPYLTQRRMAALSRADRAQAIRARRAIEISGAKAVRFFDEGRRRIGEQLPGIISSVAAQFIARLDGRR